MALKGAVMVGSLELSMDSRKEKPAVTSDLNWGERDWCLAESHDSIWMMLPVLARKEGPCLKRSRHQRMVARQRKSVPRERSQARVVKGEEESLKKVDWSWRIKSARQDLMTASFSAGVRAMPSWTRWKISRSSLSLMSMYSMQTICLLEKRRRYFSGRSADDFEGVLGSWYHNLVLELLGRQ